MNQQPRPKRIDGLETIEILVAAAEEELAAVGSVRFNLARVLKKSGISKSSAYHHFGDRDGIIAAVELRHLLGDIRAANLYIRNLIESAADAQSAMSVVAGLIVYSGGAEGMRSRVRRASTIVSAQSSPAMSNVLRDSQRDMAVFLAKLSKSRSIGGSFRPVFLLTALRTGSCHSFSAGCLSTSPSMMTRKRRGQWR